MQNRVRFAPSPTGYLHIGGLRTALYNYLFAKHTKGSNILRIEDTDRTRFVENATEKLFKALEWAGIEYDESPIKGGKFGPYIQSERLDIYKKHAEMLIANGSAYYAFDTPEEIEAMRKKQIESKIDPKYDRFSMKNQFTLGEEKTLQLINENVPYVIRLKVENDSTVTFNDIIRGEIKVSGKDIDDQVLMKSDGFPTYHLANVVDDHLMAITHVIRGEEWLPSTPKHILLYKAFGWELPQFAHLPLLLNFDRTKLSKRQGSVAVEDFIEQGFLKEAIINFVALLGWNPSINQDDLYSLDELIEHFDLSKVNKAGAIFDRQKLEWMNFQYLQKIPHENLVQDLSQLLIEKGFGLFQNDYLLKILNLFLVRVKFLKEILEIADYMFKKPKYLELEYFKKYWKPNTQDLLLKLIEIYQNTPDFTHTNLYNITKEFAEEQAMKLKDIIHPIRFIITGKSAGAGMFETMELLGKNECIDRFNDFINIHLEELKNS